MKRLYILFLGLISIVGVNGQQDALFSQYMFNPLAINPGYAGTRSSISGVLLARQQWVGIDGAPKTGSFAIHSPFKGKNFSLGFNGFAESIGPSKNSGAFLTYAYKVKLGKGKLNFGLRGGVFSTVLDRTKLNFDLDADPNNQGTILKSVLPNFDFGAYYYTQKFYFGLSSNHLAAFGGNNSNSSAGNGGTINGGGNLLNTELKRHFMLASGVALVLNPDVVFKPSVLIKYVNGAPINIDVNLSVLLNKVFWIGASYRSSNSLVLLLEYNITDFIRIGYSYDYSLGAIRTYAGGSHELFVGFDFNLSRKKVISTRYL